MNLGEILESYQQRIGQYDKKAWETTVEQRILRGLSYSPTKTAKHKTDLIDVDLVRGSTFPKAKPQADIYLAGVHGVLRIILLPFFYQWWLKEISFNGFLVIISMYFSVTITNLIYYLQFEECIMKKVPVAEVILPTALLILLSVIFSQMTCTRKIGIRFSFKSKSKERKTRKPKSKKTTNDFKVRNSKDLKSSLSLSCNQEYLKTRSFSADHFKQKPHQLKKKSKSIHDIFNNKTDEFNAMKERNFMKDKINKLMSLSTSCIYENKKDLYLPSTMCEVQNCDTKNTYGLDTLRASTINCTSNSEINYSNDKTDGVNLRYRGKNVNRNSSHIDFSYYSDNLLYKRGNIQNEIHDFSPYKEKTAKNLNLPDWNVQKIENCSRKNKLIQKNDKNLFLKDTTSLYSDSLNLNRKFNLFQSEDDGCNADCESHVSDDEILNQSNMSVRAANLKTLLRPTTPASPHRHPYSNISMLTSDDHSSFCDSDDGHKTDTSSFSLYFSGEKSESALDRLRMTNSENMSSASEWNDETTQKIDWHIQGAPAAVISSSSKQVDKVSCKIWQKQEIRKVNLSVLDISSAIISRVYSFSQSYNYCVFGLCMAAIVSFVPSIHRFFANELGVSQNNATQNNTEKNFQPDDQDFQTHFWYFMVVFLCGANRLILASVFFFLLAVAERTFKQRFLIAKHFSYLTSARRARKYDLPHFRLNKVLNIKSWLSIRSCLKKCGPQHSVNVIISATFLLTLTLVFYLGVEAVKDADEISLQPLLNCELFIWCFALSIFLIRFMTLGSQINKKYSNPSVLITEQINMYFQMEKNPQKKESLMLANNVLKLVPVLLKELDSPFKISGLSANALLYNVTKFGILSACSAVLSNAVGFKLKLHNIKFR